MLLISNRDLISGLHSKGGACFDERGPESLNSYEIKSSWNWRHPDQDWEQKASRYRLLFVHGFNTSLKAAIWSALTVESLYQISCICFSWPSAIAKWHSLPSMYLASRSDARGSSMALERLIRLMSEVWPDNRFVLAAHSMGNLILSAATPNIDWSFFERVVLIAADFPQDRHVEAFGPLSRETELHIVQNRLDYALVASSAIRGSWKPTRLGQVALDTIPGVEYHNLSGTVGMSHTYFMDKYAQSNDEVKDLFGSLFM